MMMLAVWAIGLIALPLPAYAQLGSRPDTTKSLSIRLTGVRRPFPEPLPAGQTRPAFALRGIKGWKWSPQQYLAEIPVLASVGMNFLMNCYLSMFDIEHRRFGDPDCNRWWEPLPEEKKRAYEEVVSECKRRGVDFCFCMNPNLTARRFADPARPRDLDDLWQHYQWMQELGVRWFSICLDDIGQGTDPTMQAKLVNEILRRLRVRDAGARMIFCPTFYSGDGTKSEARAYLNVLAASLDSAAYVFWTGDAIATARITRTAAESYRRAVGHRLILWDNYPVNDEHPTLNLGPVTGRDPDLCEVVDGYMSNSQCPQNEINRLPMLTCADFAYNSWGYDPSRSIEQAIEHLGENDEQREALAALAQEYPGNLLFNIWYDYNPVRARFSRLEEFADGGARAAAHVRRVERLLDQFRLAFPGAYLDARKTLEADVEWMNARRGQPLR